MGETSHVFLQACHDVFIPCVHVSSMKEAVDNAFSQTKEGDIILLSPGCSSLDMFQNYEDRAKQFVLAIDGLE